MERQQEDMLLEAGETHLHGEDIEGTEQQHPGVGSFVAARFWAGLIAGCALVIPATLVALAVVPALLGLSSATVVGSGSMSPALRVGDVVVLEPVRDRGRGLQPPSVVLVHRPAGAAPLLHRVTGPAPGGGGYTTRGDANAEDDTAPAAFGDVRGVGRVAIPVIGIPLVWLDEGRLGAVALLLAAITAVAMLARYGWSDRYDPWHRVDDHPEPAPEPALHELVLAPATALRAPSVRTAPALRAGPRHTTQHTRLPRPSPPGRPTLPRAPWAAAALVVAALAAGPASLPVSDAAFTGTTASAGNQLRTDTLAPPTDVTPNTTCTGGSEAATVVAQQVTPGKALTLPSTVQADDVLLAQLVSKDVGPGGPGGWSFLDQRFAGGVSLRSSVWQRTATSTDAGKTYTWNVPPDTGDLSIGLVVVRGAAPASDGDGNITTSTTSIAPSRTPASVPSLLLTFHAATGGAVLTTPPPMTQHYDEAAFPDARAAAYSQTVTASGATGTRTAALDRTADNAAHSVILAATGPSTPATASVEVSWTATPSTYATGYEVWRDNSLLATVTGRTTTTFTDATPGTGARTYTVRSTAGSWRSTAAAAPSLTPTCP